MQKKMKTMPGKVIPQRQLRCFIAVVMALLMAITFTSGAAARYKDAGVTGVITETGPMSARSVLRYSLEESVDSYIVLSQTIATAPYYSNSDAIDIVLGFDAIITDTAAANGVDKAVIQSILFQEIRFLNFLDEVDICVQNTFRLRHHQAPEYGSAPQLAASVMTPFLNCFSFSDSSTGLGQIYAKSAIRALNWQSGLLLYNESDWKDREEIWLRLKYDNVYNIRMIGLLCRYNAAIAANDPLIENPGVRDVLRLYNGSGPSAEKYEEVTYRYYLAFKQYNEETAADQKL